MIYLQVQKETKQFNTNFTPEIFPYKWSQLDNHDLSTFYIRVLSRKSLKILDVRKKAKLEELFTFSSEEICGGMSRSQNSPYQIYTSTNLKTMLIDERYTKIPMTQWYHSNADKNYKVPSGICSYVRPSQKLEYVSTFWPDTDVNLICNDWQHDLCQERMDSDITCQFSCQTEKDILYPLSRGRPVQIQSLRSVMNQVPMESDHARHRLNLPWTGMTIREEENVLKFMAVNYVGDIFEAVLKHEEIGSKKFDSTLDMSEGGDPFMDLEVSSRR